MFTFHSNEILKVRLETIMLTWDFTDLWREIGSLFFTDRSEVRVSSKAAPLEVETVQVQGGGVGLLKKTNIK